MRTGPLPSIRPAAAVDPERAREAARDVLDDERFRDDPTPAPLRGPLRWIGDRLRDAWDAIADVFERLPGPTWVALVVLFAALVALVVWRMARRRDRLARIRGVQAPDRADRADRVDARALEAEAEAAEGVGDYERALRLRFRAGLLRLDDAGAVTLRPDLTNREVRATLRVPTFDDLADAFEAVTYGERSATPEHVAGARRSWPGVVDEARPR